MPRAAIKGRYICCHQRLKSLPLAPEYEYYMRTCLLETFERLQDAHLAFKKMQVFETIAHQINQVLRTHSQLHVIQLLVFKTK